jgi:hypothetical protein
MFFLYVWIIWADILHFCRHTVGITIVYVLFETSGYFGWYVGKDTDDILTSMNGRIEGRIYSNYSDFLLLRNLSLSDHLPLSVTYCPHCTALHCTALHCTALHYTALHCTALHCTALHCTALHCTALHCTVPASRSGSPTCRIFTVSLHGRVIVHCTALHCTALHSTAQHCTALHCTALHRVPARPGYRFLSMFHNEPRDTPHHYTAHCTTLHTALLYALYTAQCTAL